MAYIAKYNLQTNIYIIFTDNAPSTKDDTTTVSEDYNIVVNF